MLASNGLVNFVNNTTDLHVLIAMELILRNYLQVKRSVLHVMSNKYGSKAYIKRYRIKKELWKTVKLEGSPKPQLRSV